MDTLIARILQESGYRENPYFAALNDGSLSREDFLETQIQFYFAVIFFSRPMAAAAAKIPHPRERVEVLRNVWEEHGEGNVSVMHGETFLELLNRLGGVTIEDVHMRSLWPEVRAFNTTLVGACVLDEYVIGIGALGMIERMFVDISRWIGRGIVQRGFLSEERLIHYKLHEQLDVRHSEDFFTVLRPLWEHSAEDKYYIEQGFRLGAYIFNRLYEDLYRSRGRRVLCGGHGREGLHTRVR
ncbi:MAG: iron-containing redox enzyme family protein [Planctomycetes bacterium]|nr:iron-containing redox enzyme family protein [Planctomycetota bacterium]